jgi:hypothetical protein
MGMKGREDQQQLLWLYEALLVNHTPVHLVNENFPLCLIKHQTTNTDRQLQVPTISYP